jgi:integrase
VRQHIIDASPMDRMEVPPNVPPRERVLTEHELAAVYRVAINGAAPFHRIVALLVLTGQRKGEIAHLEWRWFDEDKRTITLPSSLTKNKRQHVFPYGEGVAGILMALPRIEGSPYLFPAAREQVRGKPVTVFNGWAKPKVDFDRALEKAGYDVAHWTLHDLRRTFSSGMAALSVSQTVVEKLLNHVSGGTLSPIAQVYNRYTFMDEMRDAIRRWEAKLASLIEAN